MANQFNLGIMPVTPVETVIIILFCRPRAGPEQCDNLDTGQLWQVSRAAMKHGWMPKGELTYWTGKRIKLRSGSLENTPKTAETCKHEWTLSNTN
jgi:hypothetical protein